MGRPGLYIVLFVVLAFAALFVAIAFVTSLVWLAASVAIIATLLAIYRWRRHRKDRS